MLSDEQKRQLDRLLDNDLSDEERAVVQNELEANPEAIEWLADRALMHAQLRRTMSRRGLEAEAQSAINLSEVSPYENHQPALNRWAQVPNKSIAIAVAAALIGMLTLFFWPKQVTNPTFATLEQTHAALWESGDLATADGSRLGQGTLRLAEGLATLRFDSGAELILEAPATLTLVDAMNCSLTRGTAVSDIPDSALGFRIKTPSANVVDYGTRFAVSVFEETGETHSQVIEGRIRVEYAESEEVVELSTGQRNVVAGTTPTAVMEGNAQEHQTVPAKPLDHGRGWKLLEPIKDAYTGNVKGHNSDVLLLAKNAIDGGRVSRVAYIGFDLSSLTQKRIEEAELLLYFAPTGWGLASHVSDATFSVYGMVGDVPAWDESILHADAFPGKPEVVHLGSFEVPRGVQKGRFRVHTAALAEFLRDYPASEVSFKVVRDTKEINNGGLVHGFASRRHPVLPPPTLAIRESVED